MMWELKVSSAHTMDEDLWFFIERTEADEIFIFNAVTELDYTSGREL